MQDNNIPPITSTTICAPATTAGGAIGIIRISGPQAIPFANALFSKDISQAKGYTMHYGKIANKENAVIDDVIVNISRSPHSYTGEDTVEISHHGSSYIQSEILKLLMAEGCTMAQPGEFTQRAFLNGKMDLSQAEAVADLIASNSTASHHIAMQQMRGGISKRLSELSEQLLTLTSLLELELDFSEEDVEFADKQKLIALADEIEKELSRLVKSFDTGNALKNGIPVAIIGAPNVGKSTLLNLLLQEDKAIVSDVQGTTRDTIEDTIQIEGVMFRFIDTAGIRHTDDKVERLGIERSLKAVQQASIIILMTEPGVPYPQIETTPTQHVIRITNKSEEFQAINGKGLDKLTTQLLDATPKVKEEDVIISNVRQQQSLTLALNDIHRCIDALQINLSGDLIAEDLRLCIQHTQDVTGQHISSDNVLQNIFKNFCIGK